MNKKNQEKIHNMCAKYDMSYEAFVRERLYIILLYVF